MDTIEAQVWTDTGKRDGKGRRIVKEEERERLLAQYDGSGLTQAEFCRREGINYHTFVAWLGRRRKGRSPESEGVPGFHRIELVHGKRHAKCRRH